MTTAKPICLECKNYNDKEFTGITCKAFTDGIPDLILNGENDHKKPLKDQDNNIVFDKKPE